MLREANGRGAKLVVFTEMALTTFFPRWVIEDEAELDSFYEKEVPGPETAALFEEARKLSVGFTSATRNSRVKEIRSAGSTPRSSSTGTVP